VRNAIDPGWWVLFGLVTFIGASHDRTGDYTFAFQVFLAIVFLASGLVALVKLPPRIPSPSPEVLR